MAGKPCPVERVFPFLDPLLCSAPPVVEPGHSLGWVIQVCDDEAPAGQQLTPVPFHLGLQELVYLRFGEGGIAPEELPRSLSPVAVYHRLQHLPPPISAMYIAWSKQRPFTVPKLIEQEEGVVAHGLEVAVVGGPCGPAPPQPAPAPSGPAAARGHELTAPAAPSCSRSRAR